MIRNKKHFPKNYEVSATLPSYQNLDQDYINRFLLLLNLSSSKGNIPQQVNNKNKMSLFSKTHSEAKSTTKQNVTFF